MLRRFDFLSSATKMLALCQTANRYTDTSLEKVIVLDLIILFHYHSSLDVYQP